MSEDSPFTVIDSVEQKTPLPESSSSPETQWQYHQDRLQADFMARLHGGENSEPIPELTDTYRQAESSWQNLSEPGEANRLMVSLEALYRQAGVEDYQPEVEVSDGLSQEDGQALLIGRLSDDFVQVTEILTDRYLGEIGEAGVEYATAESKFHEAIGRQDLSRGEVRGAAFALSRARGRLQRKTEAYSLRVGDSEAIKEVRQRYTEVSAEEFQDEEIDEVAAKEWQEAFVDDYLQNKENEILGDRREAFAWNLAWANHEIDLRRKELRRSVGAAPEVACRLASEIKGWQVEEKIMMYEWSVAKAKHEVDQADEKFREARFELAEKIIEGGPGKIESLKKAARAGGDALIKGLGLAEFEAQKFLGEFSERSLTGKVEVVKEDLQDWLAKTGETLLRPVRERFGKFQETRKVQREKRENKRAKREAEKERKLLEKKKERLEKRHQAHLDLLKKKAETKLSREAVKDMAKDWVGRLIGGKKYEQKYGTRDQRVGEINRQLEGSFEMAAAAIDRIENKALRQVMEKDLEARFAIVRQVTPPETLGSVFRKVEAPAAEEENPPALKEKRTPSKPPESRAKETGNGNKDSESEKSENELPPINEVRPGAELGFYVKIRGSNGKTYHRLFYLVPKEGDKFDLYLERVKDSSLELGEEYATMEVGSKEEALQLIENKIKGLRKFLRNKQITGYTRFRLEKSHKEIGREEDLHTENAERQKREPILSPTNRESKSKNQQEASERDNLLQHLVEARDRVEEVESQLKDALLAGEPTEELEKKHRLALHERNSAARAVQRFNSQINN